MTDETAPSEIVPMMPGKNGGMLRRGGPGRAVDPYVIEVRAMLREGSKDAARSLLAKASDGDIKAIELVLAYGIGRPTDRVELSGPDGGPVELAATLTDEERRVVRDAIREHLARKAAEAEVVG